MAAVPLMSNDAPLGVLVLNSPKIGFFSDPQVKLLATIANEVAIAVHNAELYGLINDFAERMGESRAHRAQRGLGAEQDPHMFNMAHMGLRLGQRANGVSELHGHVSRGMFSDLWPGFDDTESKIGIWGHPLHAMSVAFPVALTFCAFGADGRSRRRQPVGCRRRCRP